MNNINKIINLKFSDDFFSAEEKCGYKISEKEKRIWAVELDLLNEFNKFCKRHDIRFSVYAGTLLGAVRHKGFIPWDDDVDVCLDRENFNKLLKYSNEFESPYFLQTAINDREFFIGYARLRNSKTTAIVNWQKSKDYNSGIYIDIFALDGFVNNEIELKRQVKERDFIVKQIELIHWDRSKGIKKALKKVMFNFFYHNLDYEYYIKKYNKCISKYNEKSERLTLMTHKWDFIHRYWCNKSDFNEIIEVPFENLTVPIFKNFDSILTNCYGNYMQLPPIEERGKWHENIILFDPDIPYQEYYKTHDI